MKPLDEELIVEEIFKLVKKVSPEIKIPSMNEITFMNSSKFGGYATEYEIAINLIRFEDLSLTNHALVQTVIHELVHYSGIMNHSQKFWDKLEEVLTKVENQIKGGNGNGQN